MPFKEHEVFINDERVEEYSLTTPVQIGNFAHIQKSYSKWMYFLLWKLSSHAIEQKKNWRFRVCFKIHTNITRDHLDYHKTIEEYIKLKTHFFEDDIKLINKDDKIVKYNSKMDLHILWKSFNL